MHREDTRGVDSDVENLTATLAEAVKWAEAAMPPAELPDWVFQGEIALAQAKGIEVEQGSC